MPSTSFNAFSRSRKLSPLFLPKSPVLTPVSTISRTPDAAILFASSTASAMEMLLLLPLAKGTVQYAQKLSHPSWTFRKDLVRSSPLEYAANVTASLTSALPRMTLRPSMNSSVVFTSDPFSLAPNTRLTPSSDSTSALFSCA